MSEGEGPGADQGHTGEIMSLDSFGNTSVSPPDDLEEVARKWEIWVSVLILRTLQPKSR